MRASSDLFVVGLTGLGTALFLTQLLIVSQQIVAAHNRVLAELAAETDAAPVNWIDLPQRFVTEHWQCCWRLPHPPPPHTPAARYYDISSAHIAGHPTFKSAPIYPDRALERGISGYVDFVFTTSPDGLVVDPEVIAEVPKGYGFAAAATHAFRRWRFEPGPGPDTLGRVDGFDED